MKKTMRAICAIACLSVFFSCKEKNPSGANQEAEKAETVKVQQAADSLIIYSGWDLYEERDDGKMYAVREAECGDSVSICMNEDGSIEQKNAVRHLQSGKEENLDFVHVLYEEEEYWTRDIFLAGSGVDTCVTIKDTFVYSTPDGASITSNQIDEGTFIAREEGQAEGINGFYKAVIYNGKPFGKEIYIKGEDLSGGEVIEELARVFSKIDEKTKPEVRDEIILRLYDESAAFEEWERVYFVKKLIKANKKSLVSEKVKEVLSETMFSDIFDEDFKIDE